MVSDNLSWVELKLVIIAILIPVFLETFPRLINLVPIQQTGLSLILPQILSYFLGLSWFIVLFIGLLNLVSKTKIKKQDNFSLFNRSFKIITRITLLLLVFILILYTIYLFSLFLNISLVIIIMMGIYLMGGIYYFRRSKK